MSSHLIPKDNNSYNDVNYWNERYGNDGNDGNDGSDEKTSYDWLVDYSSLKDIIRRNVSKDDSILMLGCGNSLLSEQMYCDGYHSIHNIDYSEPVISLMSLHCDKCSQMQWSVMDCCQLSFPNDSFDVVIEKATIDALLTNEKSPWDISQESQSRLSLVLSEVFRVLKPLKGQFISVSFFSPQFRFALYTNSTNSSSKLSMNAIYKLGTNFHYYCYQLIKSLEPNKVEPLLYEPPKVISFTNNRLNQTLENNVDHNKEELNFLFHIDL